MEVLGTLVDLTNKKALSLFPNAQFKFIQMIGKVKLICWCNYFKLPNQVRSFRHVPLGSFKLAEDEFLFNLVQ